MDLETRRKISEAAEDDDCNESKELQKRLYPPEYKCIPSDIYEVVDLGAEKCLKNIIIKDGGYSWIVLIAMTLSNVLTAGYVKSFGMTYNIILDTFPDTPGVMSGVMMGLLSGFRSIFAPVAGTFGNLFGVRRTMFVGTMLCFFALLSSYFCTSVGQLAFTLGAMMGIGLCMVESCQVTIIADYFQSKLSLANGMRVAGNPLGGMLYPMLLVILLETYGIHMMKIMLAGVMLQILICVALMRPVHVHQKVQILASMKQLEKDADAVAYLTNTEKREIFERLKTSLPEGKKKKKKPIDIKFLCNPAYLVFLFMGVSISLAFPLVLYYVPIYGRSIGLTPVQNSVILSFQSIWDLILRIALGLLNDRKLYKKSHGFIFCLFLGGIGCVLIPLCNEVWGLICTTTLFSFGSAGYYTFINVILTNQFGKDAIATTWGFVRMTQGIFNFIFPPILGYIMDLSGGYTIPFIVMGCGSLAGGMVLLLEPLVIRITKSEVIIT